MHSNILLIGMPGSGKSTFGRYLAAQWQLDFVDTDDVLAEAIGTGLQAYLDAHGYLALREREAEVLEGLNVSNTVIATGGSAVYGDAAMQKLKQQACCVYLEASESALIARIPNMGSRGIAKAAEQSFSDLYAERTALYRRYADITLDTEDADMAAALADLQQLMSSR